MTVDKEVTFQYKHTYTYTHTHACAYIFCIAFLFAYQNNFRQLKAVQVSNLYSSKTSLFELIGKIIQYKHYSERPILTSYALGRWLCL